MIGVFSDDGSEYFSVSGDRRFSLWDVEKNKVKCSSKGKGSSGQVSCLAFGQVDGGEKMGFVGFSNKKMVLVWNMDQEKWSELDTGLDGVDGLVLCGNDVFVCSKSSKNVLRFGGSNQSLLSKYKVGKQGATALGVQGEYVVAGGNGFIKVWDISSGAKVTSYGGHASVCGLYLDASRVLSRGDDDRYLYVWGLEGDTNSKKRQKVSAKESLNRKAAHVLTCRGVAVASCISGSLVGACTRKETVVWDLESPSEESRCIVKGGDVVGLHILAKDRCVVVRWNGVKVLFQELDMQGCHDLSQQDLPLDDNNDKSSGKKNVILHTDVIAEVKNKRQEDEQDDEEEEEASLPLGQRLEKALGSFEEQEEAAATPRREKPTPGSLATALEQALVSKDSAMLETCINTCDEKVVSKTLARLSSTRVVEFLQVVIARFDAKPVRGNDLLIWVKYALLHHADYLCTLPNLSDVLGNFYQVVNFRLANFDLLLRLHGRVNFMMTQITDKQQGDRREPSVVYDEEAT